MARKGIGRTSYTALYGQRVLTGPEYLGGGRWQPGEKLTPQQEVQWLSYTSLDPSGHRRLMGPTGRYRLQWDKETYLSGVRSKGGEFFVKSFMGYWFKVEGLSLATGANCSPKEFYETPAGALNLLVTFMEDQVPHRLRANFSEVLHTFGDMAKRIARDMLGTYQPDWPALSPETLKQWPSDTPLLRWGNLRNSIDYSVDESALTVTLGTDDPMGMAHEIGSSTEPPRPYLSPAVAQAARELPMALRRAIDVAFETAAGETFDPFPRTVGRALASAERVSRGQSAIETPMPKRYSSFELEPGTDLYPSRSYMSERPEEFDMGEGNRRMFTPGMDEDEDIGF